MIHLEAMKTVANKHKVDLYEMTNGTMIFELETINGIRPIILTVDNGDGWCVEAMGADGHMWGGHISVRSNTLEKEIRGMFSDLGLGRPDQMLQIAKDLQHEIDGKKNASV
jgi:hypothetical protein